MACQVKRNKQGNITKVLNRSGKESALFNSIASIPQIENLEQALEVYVQTYNEDVFLDLEKDSYGLSGKSVLFKTKNGQHETFLEALQEGKGNIEVGIPNKDGNFEAIYEIPRNLDKRTKTGYINSLVKEEILSDKTEIYNGKVYLKPQSDEAIRAALQIAMVRDTMGRVIDPDQIKIDNDRIQVLEKQEKEDKDELDTVDEAIVSEMSTYLSTTGLQNTQISEESLMMNLYSILTDMGIKIMDMASYQQKYKTKYGKNLSPKALADIANRVVAFKDGQIGLEELTEETMHFIVETFSEDKLNSLLEGIEQTEEFATHYESYLDAYNGDSRQAKIEVLGKIMTNIALSKIENKPQGLIQRILGALNTFFSNLTLNNSYKKNLAELNDIVEQYVIQKSDTLNSDNLSNNNYVLFSLSEQNTGQISDAVDKVYEALSQLQDNKELSTIRSSMKKLSNTISTKELDDALASKAAVAVVQSAKKIANLIARATRESNRRKEPLTGEVRVLQDKFNTELKPVLDVIINLTAKGELSLGSKLESVKEDIDIAKRTVDEAVAEYKLNNSSDKIVKDMVQRVKAQLSPREADYFGDKVDEYLEAKILEKSEDIGALMKYFGQLHNTSSPVLQMLDRLIHEMVFDTHAMQAEMLNPLQQAMREGKITGKQIAQLNDGAFIVDTIDHQLWQDIQDQTELDVYNEFAKDKITKLEDFKELKKQNKLENLEDTQGYSLAYKTAIDNITEKPFVDKYYEEFKEKNQEISNTTLKYLRTISIQRAQTKREATVELLDKDGNGTGEFEVLYTQQQGERLEELVKERAEMKQIYDEMGYIKPGLILSEEEPVNGRFVQIGDFYLTLDQKVDIENPTFEQESSVIAFEIQYLDAKYAKEVETDKANGDFVDAYTSINEAPKNLVKKILDFIRDDSKSDSDVLRTLFANINFKFSNEFYDNESIYENENFLERNSSDEAQQAIKDLKILKLKRKAILAQYRTPSKPSELRFVKEVSKKELKKIHQEIQELNKKIDYTTEEEIQIKNIGESSANNQYFKDLKEKGIEPGTLQELTFLSNHSRRSFSNASKQEIEDLEKTTQDELQQKIKFLRANLHSYYSRYAPVGYRSLEDMVKEKGGVQLGFIEYIKQPAMQEYGQVGFKSNSIGSRDADSQRNPNYILNWEGGLRQPSKELREGELKSKKYQNLFAPNSEGAPTKNKELYKVYKEILNIQKTSLKDNYRITNPNIFKRPQISKSTTEQLVNIFKGKNILGNIKEFLKELVKFRVDDEAYAEKGFEKSMVIPKYYVYDLENQSDLTDDLYYSIVAMTKASAKYNARKKVQMRAHALEDILKGRRYKGTTKTEETQTYKMFKSFLDYSIYGQIEANKNLKFKIPGTQQEVDLNPILRTFSRYASTKNLGLNLHIPMVGFLTGAVNKKIEARIAEYYDVESAKLARRDFNKLAPNAIKQTLDANDQSELVKIMQAFGQADYSDKAINSIYGPYARLMSRSVMGAHSVSNFGILPHLVLTLMYNNRIITTKENGMVDTRIYTNRTFIDTMVSRGYTKKEAQKMWSNNEKNAVRHHLDFSKGLKWNTENVPLGMTEEFKEDFLIKLRSQITDQIAKIDGVIDPDMRLEAQRSSIASLVLMHKSFLSIATQKRFKRRQMNLSTGLLEEGSYNTLFGLLRDMTFNKKGLKAFKEAMQKPVKTENMTDKEYKKSLLEYELTKRNMTRVGKEMVAIVALTAIATLLYAAADDDENEDNYILQLINYLVTKTANETATSQLGIFNEYGSTLSDPFVAWSTAKETLKFHKLLDYSEIESGPYKGMTQASRYLMKATPGAVGISRLFSAGKTGDAATTYRNLSGDSMLTGSLGAKILLEELLGD